MVTKRLNYILGVDVHRFCKLLQVSWYLWKESSGKLGLSVCRHGLLCPGYGR